MGSITSLVDCSIEKINTLTVASEPEQSEKF